MSAGESNLGVRVKQQGTEDVIAKIKQLHDELNRGSITNKEYRTAIRDTTTETRAATQEFNQIKNAIYAANPTLLDLTRTMSAFGQVAQTGLAITNAINLAILNTSGQSSKMQDLKTAIADTRLEYERFANSPNFGPLSPQAQAALSKLKELQNELTQASKDWAVQQLTNAITFGSSVALIGNQVIQIGTYFSTLAAKSGALATSVLGAFGTIVGGIAAFAGAFFIGMEVIKMLYPSVNKSITDISTLIQDKWGGNPIIAQYLMSPLLEAEIGFKYWQEDQVEFWFEWANKIIEVLNMPFAAANKLTGTHMFSLIPEITRTPQEKAAASREGIAGGVLNEWFGKNGVFGQAQSNTQSALQDALDKFNSQNNSGQNTPNPTTNPKLESTAEEQLGKIQEIANNLNIQSQGLPQTINLLQNIASDTSSNNTLFQSISDSMKTQADATKLAQSQSFLSQSARQIQNQIDTIKASYSPMPASDIQSAIYANASNQAQKDSINAKIAPLEAQLSQLEVGNQDLLANYLPTIGMSSSFGLGSVISGAIGMGGGITAQDVQDFINTHDYGVFSKAAIRDANLGTTQGFGTSYAYTAYIDSLTKMGISPSAAAQAAQAAGIKKAATGFEGMVNSPTMFMVGEAGSEYVSISPHSQGGRSAGNIIISVNGNVYANNDFYNEIQNVLKTALRRGGFT